MITCDVLIIGGGPSGSSCALKLRQGGLDVLVLDKAEFPRDKVCAGWITPAVIEESGLDLADYRSSRVLQPITGFRTSLLGGREVATSYNHPVSYGIRRCEFDHYLLSRCGARLHLGRSLRKMERMGRSWEVNGEIRAPLVVGAGGHFCPVARQFASTGEAADPAVLAQEIEFEMTPQQADECPIVGEIPELFFYPDLKGYGWCFRKGNHLNIGVGREGERNLSAYREEFCEFLRSRGRVPFEFAGKFQGHAYRLYRQTERVVSEDGVLLIGDSAGLAYSQSGEGIRPAVESGLLAAEAILEARGTYGSEFRKQLHSRMTARFGRRNASSGILSLVPEKCVQSVAGLLLTNTWFTRHVLIDCWFLHRHQPPLVEKIVHTSSSR